MLNEIEMTHANPSHSSTVSARSLGGLTGVLIAAMLAGLNNRAGAIGIADIRGQLSYGIDEYSWINTAYAAGELLAMPFASWFAITFTMRRFHITMVCLTSAIALLIPFTVDIDLLFALRLFQGICAGSLIPLLMMAALKILPPSIRLHGLALYALTATFVPNISFWIVGEWADRLRDLRWIYWEFLLGAPFSILLVAWGFPKEQIQWKRFSSMNAPGLVFGAVGLCLIAIGLDQGNRLDWLNSPLIRVALSVGIMWIAAYVVSEWHHPMPFIKFQLLARRNLYLCFSIFIALLVVFASGVIVPSAFLSAVWGYRSMQNASIGLIVGVPQIFMGSAVAYLLYQQWVDARKVFAAGLILISISCFVAAKVDASWIPTQFVWIELLQALGQPMAVVSMLFLATSVVLPSEGPYVSGCVNTFRALGSLLGNAAINRMMAVRQTYHSDVLVDRLGSVAPHLPFPLEVDKASAVLTPQIAALATADVYLSLGALSLLLILPVLCTEFIPAPIVRKPSDKDVESTQCLNSEP